MAGRCSSTDRVEEGVAATAGGSSGGTTAGAAATGGGEAAVGAGAGVAATGVTTGGGLTTGGATAGGATTGGAGRRPSSFDVGVRFHKGASRRNVRPVYRRNHSKSSQRFITT